MSGFRSWWTELKRAQPAADGSQVIVLRYQSVNVVRVASAIAARDRVWRWELYDSTRELRRRGLPLHPLYAIVEGKMLAMSLLL